MPPKCYCLTPGRHIAWSWDGDRILDSAEELEQLMEKLTAAGEDIHHVVFDYVDVE